MEPLFLTRDQALSLWCGSTDSKTLDYKRNIPREYQIVRAHTKETTWIQNPTSPNHQYHPVQEASYKQQTNHKYKSNHQQIGSRLHSAWPIRAKANEQTSSQISPYTKLTQTTGPPLGRQKSKGRKNSNLKSGKRRPQTQ